MTSIFFGSMYSKTIIRFGSCDVQNDQGLGTLTSTLIILDITKPHPINVYQNRTNAQRESDLFVMTN